MSSTRTVAALVDQVAEDARDQLVAFPTERESYRDLAARSRVAAVALGRLGVGPGDSVGVLAPAGLPLVELIIAASRRGAVIVPVNSRFKAAEVGYVVENGMMYTSGTTSRPRGCVHSHATLLHEAAARPGCD